MQTYLVLLLGVFILKFKLLRLQLAQPLPQLFGFFPGLFWRRKKRRFSQFHASGEAATRSSLILEEETRGDKSIHVLHFIVL